MKRVKRRISFKVTELAKVKRMSRYEIVWSVQVMKKNRQYTVQKFRLSIPWVVEEYGDLERQEIRSRQRS